MDLMGPTRTESMGGKRYVMVVVDNFSRYSWVELLREKSEACDKMERLSKKFQNEKEFPIVKIKSDHGKELRMPSLKHFAMSTISKRSSQPQRLHNKMGLLKGRTG